MTGFVRRTSGWIGFSLAGKALLDGRIKQTQGRAGALIAAGFRIYF